MPGESAKINKTILLFGDNADAIHEHLSRSDSCISKQIIEKDIHDAKHSTPKILTAEYKTEHAVVDCTILSVHPLIHEKQNKHYFKYIIEKLKSTDTIILCAKSKKLTSEQLNTELSKFKLFKQHLPTMSNIPKIIAKNAWATGENEKPSFTLANFLNDVVRASLNDKPKAALSGLAANIIEDYVPDTQVLR